MLLDVAPPNNSAGVLAVRTDRPHILGANRDLDAMILIELLFGLVAAAMMLVLIPLILVMAGIAGVALLWVMAPTALVVALLLWLLFPHALGTAALVLLLVVGFFVAERRSRRIAYEQWHGRWY
jgi:hypothetical protein